MSAPMPVVLPPMPSDPSPVTPLGFTADGLLRIRSAAGDERLLTAQEVFDKPTLIRLYGGEAWLRRNFPGDYAIVAQRSGGGRPVPLGIDAQDAGHVLFYACYDAELARSAIAARGIQRISRRSRLRARLRDWMSWRFHLARSAL